MPAKLTIGEPPVTVHVDPDHDIGELVVALDLTTDDGTLDIDDVQVIAGTHVSLLLGLDTDDLRELACWLLRAADDKVRRDARCRREARS